MSPMERERTSKKSRVELRPDFLSVDEVARVLRMNRNTIYLAVQRGQIPSIRFGRKIRIPAAWLELEAGRERD